jgi:predicted ABC-type ATPase
VLSAYDKVEFVRRAKEKGFFIRLFFVGTESPTINASRIAQRVMEGGHDVPITKIISRYSKSIANCCVVAKMVDRAYLYDNSVDFAEPKLLFRIIDGIVAKEYGIVNDWALPIIRFIKDND